MSEATVRLIEIEHEMNNLARQLDAALNESKDHPGVDDIHTRMTQLVEEASRFKLRTIEQIILKRELPTHIAFTIPTLN